MCLNVVFELVTDKDVSLFNKMEKEVAQGRERSCVMEGDCSLERSLQRDLDRHKQLRRVT